MLAAFVGVYLVINFVFIRFFIAAYVEISRLKKKEKDFLEDFKKTVNYVTSINTNKY